MDKDFTVVSASRVGSGPASLNDLSGRCPCCLAPGPGGILALSVRGPQRRELALSMSLHVKGTLR